MPELYAGRSLTLFFTLAAMLWFSSNTIASKSPIEIHGNLPEKSLLSISPKGISLAWRQVQNGKDQIVVMNQSKGTISNVANAAKVNPTSMMFIDESMLLLRTRDNQRLFGYEGRHEVSSAYVYNLKTNDIHALLTASYGIYSGQTNLGNIVGISKDKQHVYMTAWRNDRQFSLFRVRLDKKRKPKVIEKGTKDTIDYFLNSNNEVIARERYNNRSNLHIVEARIGNNWKSIFEEEADIRTKSFMGVSQDDKYLIMRSKNAQSGQKAFFKMSLQDGTITDPIFQKADKGVRYLITDLNRKVFGASFVGFKSDYQFFENKLNRRYKGLLKALPNASVTLVDYTPDFNQLLLLVEGNEIPAEYYMYAEGKLTFIAALKRNVNAETYNPVSITQFNARDGLVIPTLITYPKGKPPENLPAIILPHGGPESQDYYGYHYLAQFFASFGYLVMQPQFRGSKGFGITHTLAGRGEWAKKMQDDLTDTVLHFARSGEIDQRRVCIVGASYGGYAALSGAVVTPDLFKCAVSINGVADLEEMLKTERRQYGSHHWVVAYWEDLIAKGEVSSSHLHEISPINHVAKIQIPVLLLHGENDSVVPKRQSQRFFGEMTDAGKLVNYLELDHTGHYLSTAKSRVEALTAIEAFIRQHNP